MAGCLRSDRRNLTNQAMLSRRTVRFDKGKIFPAAR